MEADMPPQSIKKDEGYGIVSEDHITPIPKRNIFFENRYKLRIGKRFIMF